MKPEPKIRAFKSWEMASGGVGNLNHLVAGVVEGKADAVLAASIFHFGEYSIRAAKQRMADHGIEVRL